MRFLLLFSLCLTGLCAANWKKEVLFRATFDGGTAAQIGVGDKNLYSAPTYKDKPVPGLEGSGVEWVTSGGRKGGALKFPVKNTKAVYFKAHGNVGLQSGTLSFWLKLDPDQDLAPGFCDPLQLTDKAYNNSAIWVDFTKDDKPRHFRLGVFGALKAWNPTNAESDKNPDFNNRLVVVNKPPFTRDAWTHVAIVYSGLGEGAGTATLYVNGQSQGTKTGIKEIFDWDKVNTTIRLGINYTGLMDDIATFRRPLTEKEVKELAGGKW